MMNNRLKNVICISVLICICSIGISQDEAYTKLTDRKSFEGKLRKVSSELASVQADFTQAKHMQFLETELVSGGKFWFKSPDKVRWEYTSPYNYTVVINEGTLSLISDESENEFDMNSSEVFGQINDLMLAAVSGNIFSNANYKTEVLENSSMYQVVLIPENSSVSELIQKMELYFDKKNYHVVQMKMIEPNSDFSLIKFTNQTINEIIEDTIFRP